MKKCPTCGKTHDDSWGICLYCEAPLKDYDNPRYEQEIKEQSIRQTAEFVRKCIEDAPQIKEPQKMSEEMRHSIIVGLISLVVGIAFLIGLITGINAIAKSISGGTVSILDLFGIGGCVVAIFLGFYYTSVGIQIFRGKDE